MKHLKKIVYGSILIIIGCAIWIGIEFDSMYTPTIQALCYMVITASIFFMALIKGFSIATEKKFSSKLATALISLLAASFSSYCLVSLLSFVFSDHHVIQPAIALSTKQNPHKRRPNDYTLAFSVVGDAAKTCKITSYNYRFLNIHPGDRLRVIYDNGELGTRVIYVIDMTCNKIIHAKLVPANW